MTFAQPVWLIVGVFFTLGLIFLLRRVEEQRRAALGRFAATGLLGRLIPDLSRGRRLFKLGLCLLAVLLLWTALARPQYGHSWEEVSRKGIDILFAVDTSKSMLAEDSKPNRLQQARFAILDFVGRLNGDRIGLLPFSGSAFLLCPLTLDYEAFADSLTAVNTDTIPKGGTDLAGVIRAALEVLSNDANHKILIIVTDGEDLSGDALLAATEAKAKGMTIHCVGVGTSEGELIPLAGAGGKGFVKDEQGQLVTSRLDQKTLAGIATAGGGLYAGIGTSGEGLDTIYRQKLALIPKVEQTEQRQKIPIERFVWPLIAALILLLGDFLLSERKMAPLTMPRFFSRPKKPGQNAALLLCCLLAGVASRSEAATSGEDAYARQDYLKAAELFDQARQQQPNDPVRQYNYGTAAYKNNLFEEAGAAFNQALHSDDLQLQAKAYFNRGNAQYQLGNESRQAKPEDTINQWKQSIASYDSALQLNPDDAGAKANRQLVAEQLAELEKQRQQQDQQQQQEEKKPQDGSGQDKSGAGGDQPPPKEGDKSDSNKAPSDGAAQDRPDSGKADETKAGQEQQATKTPDQSGQPTKERPTEGEDRQNAEDGSAVADQARRQQGKMTRAEAENLLNALKNGEGELNFMPMDNKGDEAAGRDW